MAEFPSNTPENTMESLKAQLQYNIGAKLMKIVDSKGAMISENTKLELYKIIGDTMFNKVGSSFQTDYEFMEDYKHIPAVAKNSYKITQSHQKKIKSFKMVLDKLILANHGSLKRLTADEKTYLKSALLYGDGVER